MKLILKTRVRSLPETVWQKFDRDLFLRLAPPFPRVKFLRFDGCRLGDMVEIQLHFLIFRQFWISEIIEQRTKPDEITFVDEALALPFFLRRWVHRHRIVRLESGSEIIDEIEFGSGWFALDWLIYPAMWLQFAYKQLVYRRAFNR